MLLHAVIPTAKAYRCDRPVDIQSGIFQRRIVDRASDFLVSWIPPRFTLLSRHQSKNSSIRKMRHSPHSHTPRTQPPPLQPPILTQHHTLPDHPRRNARDLDRGEHTSPPLHLITDIRTDPRDPHMILGKPLGRLPLQLQEGLEIVARVQGAVDVVVEFRDPVRRRLVPARGETGEVPGVEGGGAGFGEGF